MVVKKYNSLRYFIRRPRVCYRGFICCLSLTNIRANIINPCSALDISPTTTIILTRLQTFIANTFNVVWADQFLAFCHGQLFIAYKLYHVAKQKKSKFQKFTRKV